MLTNNQKSGKHKVLTTLSMKLALELTTDRSQLKRFAENAGVNEYILFTHFNFFYSYPQWGKKWVNDQICQFHGVIIKCHLCDYTPERNHAGVGSIYILNNGVCNKETLICKRTNGVLGSPQWVASHPRHNRMILLCGNHVASHSLWRPRKPVNKSIPVQLNLF